MGEVLKVPSMDRGVRHDGVVLKNEPALAPMEFVEGTLPVGSGASFALQVVAMAVPHGVGLSTLARHKGDRWYGLIRGRLWRRVRRGRGGGGSSRYVGGAWRKKVVVFGVKLVQKV